MNIFSFLLERLKIILSFLRPKEIIMNIIPGTDHIARYLRPMDIDGNTVLSSGFEYKKKEDGELKEKELSVNWLEYFCKNSSINENIESIRDAFEKKGYGLKKNGRFAVLNVKNMREVVENGTAEHKELISLVAEHTPCKDDLSHSSIIGMPLDLDGELLVAALLSNNIKDSDLFPAKI